MMSTERATPVEKNEDDWSRPFSMALTWLKQTVDRKRVGKKERVDKGSSLPVYELPQKEFVKLHDRVLQEQPTAIQMEWQRCSSREIIVNTGAGPCTIIFVHDMTSDQIISAHYPQTTVEGDVGDRSDLPPSAANFYSLVDELATLKSDGADLQVYLFGNNASVYTKQEAIDAGITDPDATITHLRADLNQKRNDTIFALQDVGIELKNIHNFMPPIEHTSEVDHTIYIPDAGIYFMRGKVLSHK